jgi:hypothetical protein
MSSFADGHPRGLRRALVFAGLTLLLLAGPVGAASAPARHSPGPPDWAIVPDDHEGIVPPLSRAQLQEAARRAAAGPRLRGLRVSSGRPFAGDRRLLATITPNGDGLRDRATVSFRLARPATVKLVVLTPSRHPKVIASTQADFTPGVARLVWAPPATILPRTYLLRLLVSAAGGRKKVYGLGDHRLVRIAAAPVVRVQGVDASFGAGSYPTAAQARLRIATDARSLTLQVFQAGPEAQETQGYAMEGEPVTAPREVDWSQHRRRPGTVSVHVGAWPSGVYFARLTASDGRVGYAPFLVRPQPETTQRIAIVMHTDTWQAYNHQDVDGDGWGDTWYAAGDIRTVALGRTFVRGGAPPHWRRYDLPFLHWLYRTGKDADFLADEDLERFPSARSLARRYDLLVFEGHEEYATDRMYDLVAGYRNLGGNLMFLSATNFLWRAVRHGNRITRVALWRTFRRPESQLVGVQYRGNDEGGHRGAYELTPAGAASWVFAGVEPGDLSAWRSFGIEYDMTTSASPRGTQVLARVNPHMRSGLRGEMTYYKLGAAKVFSAGTLNFRGAAYYFPAYRQVLENVWARLAQP